MHKQHVVNYTVAKLNHPLSQYIPPISRIPVELLSEIFLFSCALQTRYGYEVHDLSPFDKRASPMNLTHVNGHWRHVAISHPRLWTDIYIFHMFPRSPNSLKLWLERSRNLPLHITFETRRYCWSSGSLDTCTCAIPCPFHEDPRTDEILSLMIEHSSRWEKVDFNICTHKATPFLSQKFIDLSSLKSACFFDDEIQRHRLGAAEIRYADSHQEAFWKLAAASSLLEKVTICKEIPPHMHWGQLKTLSIQGSFLDFSILGECTQLEDLKFTQPCSPPRQGGHIVLPSLKHLEMSDPCSGPELNSITLPSLQSLSLYGPTSILTLDVLLDFMERSRPPLKSLTIESGCQWGKSSTIRGVRDPSALISLLASPDLMSNLESLTMRGCPSPPDLIHFLSSPRSSSLRVLQNICIQYPETILTREIMQMITFRNSGKLGVAPLKNFQATVWNDRHYQNDSHNFPYPPSEIGEVQYYGCNISIKLRYYPIK